MIDKITFFVRDLIYRIGAYEYSYHVEYDSVSIGK
jgi:Neuraminidase (sialidase)